MPRNSVYGLTITARSPLHIATGQQLVEDFDFIYDKAGRTAYVVDAEVALLAAEQAHLRRDAQLRQRVQQFSARPTRQQTPAEENKLRAEISLMRQLGTRLWTGLTLDQLMEQRLVTLRNLQDRLVLDGRPLVRYVLHGDLSRSEHINEQIKDVFGRPYIPGSSLKGAIRTALAWKYFAPLAAGTPLPRSSGSRDHGKNADNEFEQALFVIPASGPDAPKAEAVRDVLRMLQVRDSESAAAEQIMLAPIQVFGPEQAASVINAEAIAPGASFSGGMQLEHYPFESPDATRRQLHYERKRFVLAEIAQSCREHSAALIKGEIAYYSAMKQPNLAQFYRQLADELRGLEETSFLIQLGWGTGWQSKTYGDHLQRDEDDFARLVRGYQLDEPDKRKSSQFQPGDRFPVTRKVVLNNQQPWHPLGWVRVDLSEVQR